MLTKADITQLKTIFVTKDEFNEFKKELRQEIKHDMAEQAAMMVNHFVSKEQFITAMDAIMFELKAIREEMAVIVYRQSEHSDQLENHDDRLIALESP